MCMCDRRLFSHICFSFSSFFSFGWVCLGWSCHNSKISVYTKKENAFRDACEDTDEVYEIFKIKHANKITKEKNTQRKENPSQNKWTQIKYIYSFVVTQQKLWHCQPKWDLHFGYIWWFFGHRIAWDRTDECLCVCAWIIQIEKLHSFIVFKLNNTHINILIWR